MRAIAHGKIKTRGRFRPRVSNEDFDLAIVDPFDCAQDLSFDRQFDVDGTLLLAQSAAELGERDVLLLANALARDAELLPDFLECFRFAAVQAEALKDNFLLAIIEDIE